MSESKTDLRPLGALGRRQLTDEQVAEIRAAEGKGSGVRMAAKFGLSAAAICKIRKGAMYARAASEIREEAAGG